MSLILPWLALGAQAVNPVSFFGARDTKQPARLLDGVKLVGRLLPLWIWHAHAPHGRVKVPPGVLYARAHLLRAHESPVEPWPSVPRSLSLSSSASSMLQGQ